MDADNRNLDRELEDALSRCSRLRQEKDAHDRSVAAQTLRALRPIAAIAHETLCRWNHTDGCGWGYEEGSNPNSDSAWNGYAHSRWLSAVDRIVKAERWPSAMTADELKRLLETMKAMTAVHRDALLVVEELRRTT